MKRFLGAWLLLTALLGAGRVLAHVPVVVELYTAQGCASCDRSNAFAAVLARRSNVIALTFNVDYWDYLGWKDTFAEPEFSERQRAYDKRFGLKDVYTPQIVVEGAGQASGDRQGDVDALIRAARKAPDRGPRIEPRADGTVAVDADGWRRRQSADDVWLIRYDAKVRTVQVRDGDNRGQSVSHRNVVRQLVRLGAWDGRRKVFHLPPPPEDGLATLVLVQSADGGPVRSARRQPD
jgi:hypothetical protein